MNNEFELADIEMAQEAHANRVQAIKAAIKHKRRLEKELYAVDQKIYKARNERDFYMLVSEYVSPKAADDYE